MRIENFVIEMVHYSGLLEGCDWDGYCELFV